MSRRDCRRLSIISRWHAGLVSCVNIGLPRTWASLGYICGNFSYLFIWNFLCRFRFRWKHSLVFIFVFFYDSFVSFLFSQNSFSFSFFTLHFLFLRKRTESFLLFSTLLTSQLSCTNTYPFPTYISLHFSTSRSETCSQESAERHGLHPVHHPAGDQDGVFVDEVEVAVGDAGRGRSSAEDAAAGAEDARVVAAEQGGAGEGERAGGVLQVREQGRRGRRHLRQPGQGRLRPRRRRAVLQLHGDAGGGGHLRQDGGAAEREHPPGGHPAAAGSLRGRLAQDRGGAQGRRQVRRQGRRREDGARPGQPRGQGVHHRLRHGQGLIVRVWGVDSRLVTVW